MKNNGRGKTERDYGGNKGGKRRHQKHGRRDEDYKILISYHI